jgi:hypothetical protein
MCDNHERFIIPLWIRATFRFNEDGTISILHTRPLESLEEKLVNQNLQPALKCAICKAPAIVELRSERNEASEARQKVAMEVL